MLIGVKLLLSTTLKTASNYYDAKLTFDISVNSFIESYYMIQFKLCEYIRVLLRR